MLKKRVLDEELELWRKRPLDQIEYLILDARYEKVRVAGSVRDCAVLTAIGIQPGGHRSVLGVSVSLSEAEVHWREFLVSLKQRGLHGVKLVVSDAHEGLKAARQATFAGVSWQRCQFHLAQNAMQHTPKAKFGDQQISSYVLIALTIVKQLKETQFWNTSIVTDEDRSRVASSSADERNRAMDETILNAVARALRATY